MEKNLSKKYWEQKYENDQTGWDIGYPSTPLKEYIDQLTDKNIKILVPGCGIGYEIEYLLASGFENVTVVDLAKSPIDDLRKRTELSGDQLICGDFFDLTETFDLVLEQTFFCALTPGLRKDYAKKMHDLIKPGGKLAGVLFDFALSESGPPFGGSKDSYIEIFDPYFEIEIMDRTYNSIPPRQGSELFIKMIRK